MKKLENIKNFIGNTKIIKIIYKKSGKIREIYAKAEWFNPTGSIKDRVAYQMLYDAYKNNLLKSGQEICEVTSGNMGLSITAIAKSCGNNVSICIPKHMSKERIELLKMYGANVLLFDNFEECFKEAERRGKNGAYLPRQFENESNFIAHYNTTAVEILNQVDEFDAFIAGVGTSGTLSGVGSRLKEEKNTLVYALEPVESSILTTGVSHGPHQIEGLSDDLIPKLYNSELVDGIIRVSSEDAISMAQKLCKEFGLGVGISSGANFLGATMLNYDKVVTIFSDDNKKYLSTNLKNEVSSKLVDEIELISFEVI